ncbi:CAF17-like 4Fe-4S cluster assembly/insertion protein YgfZ [Psychrobacter sp. I-STPA10]|uniref:CAF17-like 4Fe-4S cluster assembly/insertion protein YgfZ n=1 Tax=Psychrobacter sp. I-STPA10 TaxID=2585769 RepID=UPI001E302423|nr:folate-binding Fe/S cluster repair protein [Psychrobacter sp. I-STPA10]
MTANNLSTSSRLPTFQQITLQGEDAEKFLQGQITCNVKKLGLSYQPTAIANLKGRIEFGIWIKNPMDKTYEIVISSDCMQSLQAHLKKYGAFSKFTTTEPIDIYPCVLKDSSQSEPTFSLEESLANPKDWAEQSIAIGNYWITADTQGQFQPQELRLHQRGGVDYDKGCYLGQEVIARIYFKAAPKAFLHLVSGTGDTPNTGENINKIQVVNAIAINESEFKALVVARPEQIADSELQILPLPEALQADVAREK